MTSWFRFYRAPMEACRHIFPRSAEQQQLTTHVVRCVYQSRGRSDVRRWPSRRESAFTHASARPDPEPAFPAAAFRRPRGSRQTAAPGVQSAERQLTSPSARRCFCVGVLQSSSSFPVSSGRVASGFFATPFFPRLLRSMNKRGNHGPIGTRSVPLVAWCPEERCAPGKSP